MWLSWFNQAYRTRPLSNPSTSHPVTHLPSTWLIAAAPQGLFRGWWEAPLADPLYLRGAGVRLKGKSFKWRRKHNALALRLGYSHATTVAVPPTLTLGVLRRNFLAVWGTSAAEVYDLGRALRGLREPNIYHGRGLRFSKHRLLRKAGKVSAYR